jgi:hypothetical protein
MVLDELEIHAFDLFFHLVWPVDNLFVEAC